MLFLYYSGTSDEFDLRSTGCVYHRLGIINLLNIDAFNFHQIVLTCENNDYVHC